LARKPHKRTIYPKSDGRLRENPPLLVTVASVDTYFAALMQNWFGATINPASHVTILIVTLVLLVIQSALNMTGAQVMGRVAQFGVYVEILGTIGIAIVLAIHGFHHNVGYLFSTQGVQNVKTNPMGLNFNGSYFGALMIAVLAPVYIFYGFESAGESCSCSRAAGGSSTSTCATTRRSPPRCGNRDGNIQPRLKVPEGTLR
jgi:hypothetical protein